MNATITIRKDEIEAAIKEYVERKGWRVPGRVTIGHDTDNDRGIETTTYTASMEVSPTPKQDTADYTR